MDDSKHGNAFQYHDKTIDDLVEVSIAGTGEIELADDLAGSKVLLMEMLLSCDTDDTTVQVREKDDSPVHTGPISFNDNGGFSWPMTGYPHVTSADGKGLELNAVTGTVNGIAQILVVPISA